MTHMHAGMAAGGGRAALVRLCRLVILVPEAPILAGLLGAYAAFGEAPIPGAAALVVALAFGVRAASLLLAQRALAHSELTEAAALLRVAGALHPWSADTLALRGALALAHEDAALAARLLRRSLELLPGRPAIHAALSGALLELGLPSDAAQEARRALDLDAGCAEALLHLAESDRRAGAPQGLVEDRLRAGIAAAHTLETEAALRCALAWHLVGQERRAEARLATSGIEATLTRVAAPARDRLRLRLCELLLAQGQAERARELMAGAAS